MTGIEFLALTTPYVQNIGNVPFKYPVNPKWVHTFGQPCILRLLEERIINGYGTSARAG